jgi:hypothetical protein
LMPFIPGCRELWLWKPSKQAATYQKEPKPSGITMNNIIPCAVGNSRRFKSSVKTTMYREDTRIAQKVVLQLNNKRRARVCE